MAVLDKSSRLTKQLSLFHVYALATGATLSSGLFLLPGIAADRAQGGVGPAIVLSYLIAAVPLVPAMFSIVELSTAMPRAGGAYYFLDRSLGPLFGTVGGMGTWLALTLKTAFALIGMGAYAAIFLPDDLPDYAHTLIACGLAVMFAVVNLFGARNTGRLQVVLALGLLMILVWFIARGTVEIEMSRFDGFLDAGTDAIFATAGLVYISYVGITKVASVSEEVENPDYNLPTGLFLALGTAVLVYACSMIVMTGVVPPEVLEGCTTPMAAAAEALVGRWGVVLISVAALLAFFSVANAGIMSASRYPLAMSRDHLVPRAFRVLSRRRTPVWSILFTLAAILLVLLVLDVKSIAKLASAFQLLMFALICLAVIVMRESRIESYDPGYRSPLYPWMQILGIAAPMLLIGEMGWVPIVFSVGLIVVGFVWYEGYARRRVERGGAIFHVFERLGRRRFADLDSELRGILKEKGLRAADPFAEIVLKAGVVDTGGEASFETIAQQASTLLARKVPLDADTISRRFLEGTRVGATPVSKGAALPHFRLPDLGRPMMVIVRARKGVTIEMGDVLGGAGSASTAFALFFLVSPEDDPGQHLRLLAELASRVDQEDFMQHWSAAEGELLLKEALIRHERHVTLLLRRGRATESLIDRAIREIELPAGCLVAVVRRGGDAIVPGGDTVLQEGDRLTVIGSEKSVRACMERYCPELVRGAGAPADDADGDDRAP